MNENYTVKRNRQQDMLRSVAEGRRVAHVWHSPRYPGAEMVIQYRWPGIEINPNDHGLPAAFAEDVEIEYAGPMTPGRAAEKLANMRVAEQSQAIDHDVGL